VLQRRVPPDELQRSLEVIEREDRRLGRFADELLDFGTIRTGRLQFELEEVDLTEVVAQASRTLASDLERSGSTLTVSAPGHVKGRWDRARLEKVVINLLSNAIKFGRGQPIEITLLARDGRAVLAVRDRGIGIAPEARERIFEPFERGVSTRNYGGLGLGLHIVKTIVAALGGTVAVESELGAGSTFVVGLPQEPGNASPRR